LDRRLGGPQSRSRRSGEEKNSQPLPGLEPQIIKPIAQRYTTELFLFSAGSFNILGMLITNFGQDISYIIESFQQLKG
jgi:hypothetical protein